MIGYHSRGKKSRSKSKTEVRRGGILGDAVLFSFAVLSLADGDGIERRDERDLTKTERGATMIVTEAEL